MCSTKKAIELNPCASVKLVPYRPMRVPKQMQCSIHPRRANCKAMRPHNNYSDPDNENDTLHMTVMNCIFLNEHKKLYYRHLLRKETDQAEARKTILNAENVYECTLIRPIRTEHFRSVDEAGEHNMTVLKIIIDAVIEYLSKLADDEYILIVDRMYVDLIYSEFRAVILPQSAYIIKGDYVECGSDCDNDNDDDDFNQQNIQYPWKLITTNNLIVSTDESRQSQYIYRTFLLYNTILTAILRQTNPFDVNNNNTSISIIARNLGNCPNNKNRIKCCDLNYGGAPPGHIMCPPREITKRIFRYAKWGRNPNNYKRYSEIIARQSDATGGVSTDLRENVNNDLHARDRAQLYLLDWQNFMGEFSSYFGLSSTQ
ncbi:ORF-86 [Catopsilia pomona nucleopolyhedrovirus]|uniref:ORF-86 n=1 Tax=Catopsilia pomona nucleopolyhedrovirus TaxID=1850906 RepID=A0A172WZG3_9ABAC|nr:ORF-86 [Catopsilia pomona nucleopolyhedrovirus]ANF29734.1 ORF-86 [Catopsilia pomona nucleopolyhedrovirus]